jgi:sec-independent protein translocase protein TatC
MSLLEHLGELRKRVIVSLAAAVCASVAAYIFFDPLAAFLFRPFRAIEALASREQILFVNSVFEGFLVRIKVSILAGVVFSLPVHIYNLIKFILPGLTGKERRVVLLSLIISFGLVVFGFYYGYFYVIPLSLKFLSSSGFIPANVGVLLSYGKNILVIFQFLLVTVIVFQLPLLLEMLMIVRIISRKGLLKSSRYVIVGIFILAAIVTPPDYVSQLSLALPLVALFFLAILIAKIFNFGEPSGG